MIQTECGTEAEWFSLRPARDLHRRVGEMCTHLHGTWYVYIVVEVFSFGCSLRKLEAMLDLFPMCYCYCY